MTDTITKTIAELAEGDIVFAIEGKPRPFPYTVIQVINQPKYKITTVKFAHGGLIPPCDSKTAVTVMA